MSKNFFMINKIAKKNVFNYWKHSLSAILAISSGVVSICLFQGYVDDLKDLFHETISKVKMIGDIIVEDKRVRSVDGKANPYKYFINEEDQAIFTQFFKKHPEYVETYNSILVFNGMISNGPKTTIFTARAYDVENGLKLRGDKYAWDALYGKPLHLNSNKETIMTGGRLSTLMGCVYDQEQTTNKKGGGLIAEEREFNCRVSELELSVATETNQMNALNLSVSGVIDGNYKEIDDKYVVMSLENGQRLLNSKKISFYGVKLKSWLDFSRFKKDLEKELGDKKQFYDITRWENHFIGEIYQKNMSLFALFRNFVLTVIVVIAGLSVFNTMMKIVFERQKEIGTLRSLGHSSRTVQSIFLLEGLYISLIGSSFGLVFSFVATLFINAMGFSYKSGMLTRPILFKIAPSVGLYFISILTMSLLSLFATWLATQNIKNKKIIEYLSHV